MDVLTINEINDILDSLSDYYRNDAYKIATDDQKERLNIEIFEIAFITKLLNDAAERKNK